MTLTEILFYYESKQNPNGDPGFENQPRMMPDDTIMVTDVRVKRTMRDYARDMRGETLFVDFNEKGLPTTADGKAKEILGSLSGDVIAGLLKKTFDVPLFGALVTIRKGSDEEGGSAKLTGPLQFGNSRSVNKVQIINPTIVGRFVGKEKTGQQFSTFGKFYSVEFALIKVQGAINSNNLGKYSEDKEITKKFNEKISMVPDCLWNGTNKLITRSKYPQRSILYIDVSYKNKIYSDLPNLVNESKELKGMAKDLGKSPFDFSKLIDTLSKRKSEIEMVQLRGAEDIAEDVDGLGAKLKSKGIPVKILSD
jgi:CRISPR-associated protein Csh2